MQRKFLTIKNISICLLIIGLFVQVLRQHLTGSVTGGDSVIYYSSLRSLIIDNDMDFANEYKYFNNAKSKFTKFSKLPIMPLKDTSTDKYPMKYPIGTILSWAPFYLTAHIIGHIFYFFTGDAYHISGYSSIYCFMTSISALFYSFLAFYLIYNFLSTLLGIDRKLAFIACITIAFASPISYYIFFAPTFSHAISMFWCSFFLILFFRYYYEERFSIFSYMSLAFIFSMAVLTRYQNIFILLVPLVFIFVDFRKNLKQFNLSTINLLVFILTTSLMFSPQLLINFTLHGSIFKTGYEAQTLEYALNPRVLYVLFSIEKGLFVWTPVTLISIIGLFFLKKKRIRLSLIIFFISQIYIVSAWYYYSQGDSFSIRMLINCTPVFIFGIIPVIEKLKRRRYLLYSLPAVFILLNCLLMIAYAFRIIGPPYGFAWTPGP